jgi:hypothetical protein
MELRQSGLGLQFELPEVGLNSDWWIAEASFTDQLQGLGGEIAGNGHTHRAEVEDRTACLSKWNAWKRNAASLSVSAAMRAVSAK